MLRTMDAYPQFQIIICTIFIFLSLFLAVLSTFFGPCFLSFPHARRLLSLTPTTLRFFYILGFRVGPSIAVSRTNGPGFAFFSLSLSPIFTSYLTCMTSFFILCYIPSPTPCVLFGFGPIPPFSYDPSPSGTDSCSPLPPFTFSDLQLSYRSTLCIKTTPSVTPSNYQYPLAASRPIILPMRSVYVTRFSFCARALMHVLVGMKPHRAS